MDGWTACPGRWCVSRSGDCGAYGENGGAPLATSPGAVALAAKLAGCVGGGLNLGAYASGGGCGLRGCLGTSPS